MAGAAFDDMQPFPIGPTPDLHRMLMAIVSLAGKVPSGVAIHTARVPQYGNDVLKSCGRIMALSGRTRLRNSGRSQQKSE
jgi:hypothetical protein